MDEAGSRSRQARTPRPLDAARLEELALAYVARFATSASRLAGYLRRKLAERGWSGDDDDGVTVAEALVARFVAAGFVDDAAYARVRSAGLLRRGYGSGRIEQVLRGAGIADEERAAVRAGEAAARAAALRLAQKRGFGPFARGEASARLDRAAREKQIAAMLRAGHPLDSARRLIDAATVDDAHGWVEEEQEDGG
jgi:regulatory protein